MLYMFCLPARHNCFIVSLSLVVLHILNTILRTPFRKPNSRRSFIPKIEENLRIECWERVVKYKNDMIFYGQYTIYYYLFIVLVLYFRRREFSFKVFLVFLWHSILHIRIKNTTIVESSVTVFWGHCMESHQRSLYLKRD